MTDATHPALDVVIATRNRPQLLREALRAVLEQDYPGLVTVHVVFDQCALDEALARDVPPGPNRRLVTLANHRSPGLAGARNSGVLAGTSPLVAFCDDDDLWLPHKVARQVAELTRTGADTVVSGIVVEYQGHRTTRVPEPAHLEVAALVRRRAMEAHPSTVMVRRAALAEGIGLVDEQIPGSYGEDFDWIIRAAQHGPLAVCQEPLVRVRWGGSQFSQDWDVIVRAIDYGLAKHEVFHQDRRALARLLGRRAFALAALRRPGALRAAWRTTRTAPQEPRAYLAAAVALRVVSAERLLALAHRRGHGI